MTPSERWPRDAFRDAVWRSDLRPLERLVALAYAEHARDQEFAWVTYPRLRDVTGLSRDAIARAMEGLRRTGWLVEKEAARQQKSTRYWLRVPDQQSASQTAGYPHESVSRTAGDSSPLPDGPLNDSSSPSPDASPLPPDTSSPSGRADQSSDHSEDHSLNAGAGTVPPEHRGAVVDLVARLGREITADDAAACVAWVASTINPKNLAGYVSRFPAEDVVAKAAQQRGTASSSVPDPRACPHGVIRGLETTGIGSNASRRCGPCEAADPAPASAVARPVVAPTSEEQVS